MQRAGACVRTSGILTGVCVCVASRAYDKQQILVGWSSVIGVQSRGKGACRTRGRVPGAVSRLLVGVFFVRVPGSVLDVRRAGAQPVQVATVLGIVDVVLKEHLWGEKGVTAGQQAAQPIIMLSRRVHLKGFYTEQ